MTVAVFVNNESDAACLIPWGVHFANLDHTELLVVCPRKSKGKRGWDPLELSEKDDSPIYHKVFETLELQNPELVVLKEQIANGSESTDMNRVAVETRELVAPDPENAFVEEIAKLNVDLLLLPANEHAKASKDNDDIWTHVLFREAPCQVAIVRGGPPACEAPCKILVASHNDVSTDDELALSRAFQLARGKEDGKVTLVYVRPDDDLVALQVAEKHVRKLARLVSDKKTEFRSHIELNDSFADGVNQLALDEYDLLIIGTRNPKTIRSMMRRAGQSDTGPVVALATIRQAVPLADRLWGKMKNVVRGVVPQMDREHRVALVDRLQTSSKFDFDFVALISLSTLIAALGLARNSGAVVIGAMLVAPLMTPLVAMGFALVQGNGRLVRDAFKSVVLGFTVALLIGATIGLMLHLFAPRYAISSEMLARGAPNMLDLIVALASGVAGAYAMGRPNLLSALPGVAIAAALVPPIATSGLALTMGNLTLSAGASLLFLTNIVAIVLGTAVTFWAVGISTRQVRDADKAAQMWPRFLFIGCVVISFLMAAGMHYFNPLTPDAPSTDVKSNIQKTLMVD